MSSSGSKRKADGEAAAGDGGDDVGPDEVRRVDSIE